MFNVLHCIHESVELTQVLDPFKRHTTRYWCIGLTDIELVYLPFNFPDRPYLQAGKRSASSANLATAGKKYQSQQRSGYVA